MSDVDPEAETVTQTLLDEINILKAEARRLQRRCEIYAAGVSAIAIPLPGTTDEAMVRIAQDTLSRVKEIDQAIVDV